MNVAQTLRTKASALPGAAKKEVTGNFRQLRLKRRLARPILDLVARCPELAFLGLATLFVCLPGVAQAQDAFSDGSSRIYTLHVPNSGRPSTFQVSVTYSASNAAIDPDAPGG